MVLETAGEIMSDQNFGRMESEQSSAAGSIKSASIDDCLEVVISWIEGIAGKNYFMTPLGDFQAQFGKVNSDDEFYQTRMNYFLEHCVLERAMTGHAGGRSPLSVFLEQNSDLTANDDASARHWRSFCGFRHGLFQVMKTGEKEIMVMDLLAERKLKISSKAGETLKYFPKKSVIQGYIFGQADQYVLGQGLIIHPEAATQQILKFLKNHKKYPRFSAQEIARLMAQTNMRFLRMQHVNPAVIYSGISA